VIYRFRAKLTPDQLLEYYQGHVKSLLVLTEQRLKLQIDLVHFKPFFSYQGLDGYFELTTSDSGQFLQLKKIN